MLMPIAAVTLSLALWSDEQLKPLLVAQAEEIQPMVAEYLADTPLENMLGFDSNIATRDESGPAFEEEAMLAPSTLIASARPVVRPGAQ